MGYFFELGPLRDDIESVIMNAIEPPGLFIEDIVESQQKPPIAYAAIMNHVVKSTRGMRSNTWISCIDGPRGERAMQKRYIAEPGTGPARTGQI